MDNIILNISINNYIIKEVNKNILAYKKEVKSIILSNILEKNIYKLIMDYTEIKKIDQQNILIINKIFNKYFKKRELKTLNLIKILSKTSRIYINLLNQYPKINMYDTIKILEEICDVYIKNFDFIYYRINDKLQKYLLENDIRCMKTYNSLDYCDYSLYNFNLKNKKFKMRKFYYSYHYNNFIIFLSYHKNYKKISKNPFKYISYYLNKFYEQNNPEYFFFKFNKI